MGRTLQNTMVNLALENACDEATYQVGQNLFTSFKRAPSSIKRGFGEDNCSGSVVLCSWVWTWRNWKTWRKMLVWETEVWDVLPVSIF